jgi:hypothetical protein
MIVLPMRMPIGSEGGQNDSGPSDSRSGGIMQASANPTVNPRKMAAPPSVGVGTAWTLRSSGMSTAPIRRARRSTPGVAAWATRPAATSTIA